MDLRPVLGEFGAAVKVYNFFKKLQLQSCNYFGFIFCCSAEEDTNTNDDPDTQHLSNLSGSFLDSSIDPFLLSLFLLIKS